MYATHAGSPSVIGQETAAAERTQLEQLGFTEAQIDRLFELRAVYPLVELVETREEMMRLMFLKWLHAKWIKANAKERRDV